MRGNLSYIIYSGILPVIAVVYRQIYRRHVMCTIHIVHAGCNCLLWQTLFLFHCCYISTALLLRATSKIQQQCPCRARLISSVLPTHTAHLNLMPLPHCIIVLIFYLPCPVNSVYTGVVCVLLLPVLYSTLQSKHSHSSSTLCWAHL